METGPRQGETEQLARAGGRSERDRDLIDRAVAQAKRGDQEGIRFIYSTYSEDVFRFVRSIIGDEHEAEDVTQAVFLKLMRVITKYERGSGPVQRLVDAGRAQCGDRSSARASPGSVRGNPRPVTHEDIDVNLQRLMEFRGAVAALQDEQREVVLIRHVHGLTPGEIATRLGKSEGAVHGLHHRGRRAVQSRLRERGLAPVTR